MPWRLKALPAALKSRSRPARGSFGLDIPVERKGRFAVSAKESRTVNGRLFDSQKEATRYAELKQLERAGLIECLELQPTWTIEIKGQHYCRFSADFAYLDNRTGKPVVEDTKSKNGTSADAAYRLRKRAAELAHGIVVKEIYK